MSSTRATATEPRASRRDLQRRLDRLEKTLGVLREELGTTREAFTLPQGRFEVLRVDLGGDTYGIPVVNVQESIRSVWITRVTDLPDAVLGAINLRGRVLPVVDGRKRLGVANPVYDLHTPIVIAKIDDLCFGVVVDRLIDVVTATSDDIEAAGGPLAEARCVAGVLTRGGMLVQLLDLGRLVDARALAQVRAEAEALVEPAGGAPA